MSQRNTALSVKKAAVLYGFVSCVANALYNEVLCRYGISGRKGGDTLQRIRNAERSVFWYAEGVIRKYVKSLYVPKASDGESERIEIRRVIG